MGSREYSSFLGKNVDLRLALYPDVPVVGRLLDETPTAVLLQMEGQDVMTFTKKQILIIKEVKL